MATYPTGGYPPSYQYDDRPSGRDMLPFFVSGEGIKRQVIQTDLPRYLGNNAYSRPGHNQGVEGYWYTAYRPLTDAQIQSLKVDSQKWNSERELMSRHYPGRDPPGYERSATFRDSLRINSDGSNPDHPYPSFPPPNPAPPSTTYPTYGVGPGPGYQQSTTSYGAPPPHPGAGGLPPPTSSRDRYQFVPMPEGGKWYDHELKQWVVQPSYNPPGDPPVSVPRPRPDDPQPGAPEDPDTPSYPRRPMPPQDPAPGDPQYYPPGSYYQRN